MKKITKQEEVVFIALQPEDVMSVAPVMDELVYLINNECTGTCINETQSRKAYEVLRSIGFLPYYGTLEEEIMAEEETKLCDVILETAGEQQIKVINAIKRVFPEVRLKEIKNAIDNVPYCLVRRVNKNIAEILKEGIEEVGGVATIQEREAIQENINC